MAGPVAAESIDVRIVDKDSKCSRESYQVRPSCDLL